MEDDGIVINGIKDLVELKKKGNIDIYKVIVTTKKGEKKKLNEVIMSLSDERKAVVNLCMKAEKVNIFVALRRLNIIDHMASILASL